MTAPVSAGLAVEWLSLREPADAAARAAGMLDGLTVAGDVHDLGSGTDSMRRWLGPRLPGRRWHLYDRLPELLREAAGDGATVHCADITALTAADLAGAGLITASALLDLLTGDELDRVVAACVTAGCPVLFTLSVTGRVRFTPPDPDDRAHQDAFNAHQRRGGRLGPTAGERAVALFTRHGYDVRTAPSDWHLTPGPLATEWLRGWVDAASGDGGYFARRRASLRSVTVGHVDLLARPPLNR